LQSGVPGHHGPDLKGAVGPAPRIGGAASGAVGGTLEGAQTFQRVLEQGGTEQEAATAMLLMSLASGRVCTRTST
jgi:hypothetical protein